MSDDQRIIRDIPYNETELRLALEGPPAGATINGPPPMAFRKGIGMPAALYLNEFGSHLWHVFGEPPYHVGSSLFEGKEWRDVDVRTILWDAEFDKWFPGMVDGRTHSDGKWVALCMAFSELGRRMTGLPIDFQIQRQTQANKAYKDQPRSSLGAVDLRMEKPKAPPAPPVSPAVPRPQNNDVCECSHVFGVHSPHTNGCMVYQCKCTKFVHAAPAPVLERSFLPMTSSPGVCDCGHLSPDHDASGRCHAPDCKCAHWNMHRPNS